MLQRSGGGVVLASAGAVAEIVARLVSGTTRRMGVLMAVCIAVLMLGPGAAMATTTASPGSLGSPPGRLVSVEWLQKNLVRDDVLVLDASPGPAHRKQHIAGAVGAGFFPFGPGEVVPAQVQNRLRGWGVKPGQQIVIVDQGATYMATRLFWDLLLVGYPVERLSILDGGMAKWVSAGGAVTDQPSAARPPSGVTLGSPVPDVRVKLPEFLAATADPQGHVMLEALDPEYFYGGAAFFNRGGHVPHATLMPADDFFNADKTFKSPAQLQAMLQHLGVRPEQQVLTYCGGGGAAAVPFFALKFLLGYPQVKLFQESQKGWLQDQRELPVWTFGAPHLTRNTDWLKAWSSPMLKSFGLSSVTAVDVRPAEAFVLGHVPLAVNLPALELAAQAQQPARLVSLLQAAGLDPRHEAVIYGEGGVNARSALSFLLLHQMGQQKVSIHLEGFERWVDGGLDVARPPAAAAAAAPTAATTAAPAVKPAPTAAVLPARQPRTEVLVADPGTRPGLFPTVYVSSGSTTAKRLPQGTVVHLPATAMLTPEGAPRPAMDIWTAISKAGVPRYARVVLFADQLGDAAMNYVIFKLMGFADVQVWAP